MKNLIVFFLILFCSKLSAQHIGGFYSGTLVNDTTKMIQKYELALNEYRDKIWGYSYTTFIANDTFYYGVKKVSGYRKNGELIIEDEKMLDNNFPESPAKKVKRTSVIKLADEDTLRSINGSWHTNRTKLYYAVVGSLDLERSTDSSKSPLIMHLKELNIISQPNYAAEVKAKPKKEETKIKVEEKKNDLVKAVPLTYDKRINKTIQTIDIAADSLELSFYDNGVIDGDSISVYLNNVNIVSAIKLTATATKRSVKVSHLTGDLQLVLVAENLGTLPPNTGLLVIKDGSKSYQINFSADMQTNAAIVIRQKK